MSNFSIGFALNEIAKLYRVIYFQSMINEEGQTIENIKKSQKKFVDGVMNKLHNKYEDHIEGIKKKQEKFQKNFTDD